MSDQVLARLHGVYKKFPRVTSRADRVRAMLRILWGGKDPAATEVLHNINLEVCRGESLGIIGQNGAGKSTLLKVLTGVLAPSTGYVQLNGSVAALLELGAGFHPEFTGRENIAMAGALMGFTTHELNQRMDDILAFADIGRYVDEPIKHYSSGMVVRLGFALVAVRRPDLLITDEVLAVGDEAFQRKCIHWIEDYLTNGGTLMLVSHSMYHIQKMCRHACWIDQGRIQAYGDVYEVTQQYLASQERRLAAEQQSTISKSNQYEFGVDEFSVNGQAEDAISTIDADADFEVRVAIHSREQREPAFCIGVVRADGTPVYGTTTEIEQVKPRLRDDGYYEYVVQFNRTPLLPGTYTLRAHAQDPEGMRIYDTLERTLVVRGRSREFGLVRLPHKWIQGSENLTQPKSLGHE
jgi:lipopolysaccharide transport system ATP-binding protein